MRGPRPPQRAALVEGGEVLRFAGIARIVTVEPIHDHILQHHSSARRPGARCQPSRQPDPGSLGRLDDGPGASCPERRHRITHHPCSSGPRPVRLRRPRSGFATLTRTPTALRATRSGRWVAVARRNAPEEQRSCDIVQLPRAGGGDQRSVMVTWPTDPCSANPSRTSTTSLDLIWERKSPGSNPGTPTSNDDPLPAVVVAYPADERSSCDHLKGVKIPSRRTTPAPNWASTSFCPCSVATGTRSTS